MLHEQYAIVEDTVYGRSYWPPRIASAVTYKLSISGVCSRLHYLTVFVAPSCSTRPKHL